MYGPALFNQCKLLFTLKMQDVPFFFKGKTLVLWGYIVYQEEYLKKSYLLYTWLIWNTGVAV